MNFSSTSNITLSDSISGYITADEDEDADDTRYLSVLSQDMTFEGMNITLSNAIDDNDATQLVEVTSEETDQPIIFTIDGSNEIFGVQVVHDEEGNFQKYQFQYRENMNGELVPLLETLQMLPLDDELQESSTAECIISHEVDNLEEVDQTNKLLSNEEQSEFTSEEQISASAYDESKPEPVTSYVNVKEERIDLFDENTNCLSEDIEENDEFEMSQLNLEDKTIHDALVQNENEEETIIPAEHLEIINAEEKDESTVTDEQSVGENQFEQLFVQDNDDDTNQSVEHMNDNDSDNDMYHIVDGIHITGDIENEGILHGNESILPVLKETMDHHTRSNILKKSSQHSVLRDKLEQKVLYVQTLVEKENVDLMEIGRLTQLNSRSLLKCNQPQQSVACVQDMLPGENSEDKFSKRYSRTKEAKQARQFMNFINSTTIPQVPERKERLPRKQQIKPLKHPNEDIEVKEMIVSPHGFIEPISAEQKKYLPVTEYVELLDSGDECETLDINRRKKKKNKSEETIEIEISDSDESNASIIDADGVESTEEKKVNKTNLKLTKKKRGRPPKNKNIETDKKDSDSNSESPPKISRTESDVESVTSTFQVIRMENEENTNGNIDELNDSINNVGITDGQSVEEECDVESLPSMTTEECLRTAQDQDVPIVHSEPIVEQPAIIDVKSNISKNLPAVKKNESCNGTTKKWDYKFECEKCKSKFINKFLLNRHECKVKQSLPHSCNVCHKKFPNLTSLNVHKKIHIKVLPTQKTQSMNIPIATSAPKRAVGVVRNIFEPSTKEGKGTFNNSVAVNKNTVKTLIPAKPAVNTLRQIVLPKNSNSRLLNLPSASGSLLKPNVPIIKVTPDKTSNINVLKIDKKCDKCPMRFNKNAAWFDHQVLQHGLKTPDKNIGKQAPKKLAKNIIEHAGVPATSALAKTFLSIKSSIQQQKM